MAVEQKFSESIDSARNIIADLERDVQKHYSQSSALSWAHVAELRDAIGFIKDLTQKCALEWEAFARRPHWNAGANELIQGFQKLMEYGMVQKPCVSSPEHRMPTGLIELHGYGPRNLII